MMHASVQCGIVPSNVTRYSKKQTRCFSKSYVSTVLILHFSMARCIVSIIANTSLMSETLLTKRAILSDAYTCTCSYYTCKYSRLSYCSTWSHLFMSQKHSNRPSVLACHTSIALTSNSAPRFQLMKSERGPYVQPGCTNER